MREVSSDEIRLALANPENQKIIKAVQRRYQAALSKAELESASITGLWKALQGHNELFGQKFTSSLYRYVNWECGQELLRNKRRVSLDEIEEPAQPQSVDLVELNELLDRLPPFLGTPVRQYYLERMTLKEIGLANGYSYETARQKIRKGILALKKMALG